MSDDGGCRALNRIDNSVNLISAFRISAQERGQAFSPFAARCRQVGIAGKATIPDVVENQGFYWMLTQGKIKTRNPWQSTLVEQ
ncbi:MULTISPECIES: hypothetical protein [unclassified Sulfitobacter]|uniref:hypothetical protein n=1 Tax=unclassified Sulfitobacter TaxID=196795 RepID=UPI0023E21954|nr:MULTISPECIES: hypothetical protein [unclassified Sulfitobacter]MDF3352118.1 hypothetical protein [Sulfitobacter sp. KE12]MDF3355774.1 hypothetical protein [Sulfitobacter sp. KE27]MDF3374110.1 hypothetical protein [Sulfitobacter sp. KS8]MDF3381394.1 hypothetical protein [Sulfitobacter sp. KE32]MDF3409334.1 hypothetical protein [Sulfitobacter sp. Ks39]MDF3453338.1 hypothetical protein [Sulfitobacter sp. KE35]